MEELPNKIKDIDVIRFNRNLRKICKCEQPKFEIDTKNNLVYCTCCGAIWNPFDVLVYLTTKYERLENQVKSLLEQRKEIAAYKPWRVGIKNLEKNYANGKMMPHCPKCGELFKIEEITMWSNKKFYKEN